jgi:hypothetical protein
VDAEHTAGVLEVTDVGPSPVVVTAAVKLPPTVAELGRLLMPGADATRGAPSTDPAPVPVSALPTPTHEVMVGHEMDNGNTGPSTDPRSSGVHDPPLSVSISVKGSELFGAGGRQPPMATHDVMEPTHETPSIPLLLPLSLSPGRVPSVHVVPLSVSTRPASALGSADPYPTAMHEVTEEHQSDLRISPFCKVDAVHVVPDSVSTRPLMALVPGPQLPTATHDVVASHWMLVTSTVDAPDGSVEVEGVQMPPDSVSKRAWESLLPSVHDPAATHAVMAVQLTEFNEVLVAPTGARFDTVSVHVPAANVSINAPWGAEAPVEPTAMHEVADAHQMPLRKGKVRPCAFNVVDVHVAPLKVSITAPTGELKIPPTATQEPAERQVTPPRLTPGASSYV